MSIAEVSALVMQGIGILATVTIAVWAIFGDHLRAWLFGPELRIHLLSGEGGLTFLEDGTPGHFYKIRVWNERWKKPRAQAKNVRVMLIKISRPTDYGVMTPQAFSGPLQLTWQFPQVTPQYPTIGPAQISTFGKLIQGEKFTLTPYFLPSYFDGTVGPNERIQVELIAIADNAQSESLCLDITWNGHWDIDPKVMTEHLMIREVNPQDGF